MTKLRDELPPPNSLVVFEAAARHLNYTRAAEELGVTQAAVSRQMKKLEGFVGRPLFSKKVRNLRLTEDGRRLQVDVSQGLRRIADAVQGIRLINVVRPLTITTTASVAMLWLTPRLQQFRKLHAGIDVSLIATDWLIDMKKEEVDIAIRYGAGNWTGGKSILLFDEEIFPVCSPEYLKQHPMSGLEDLKTADLIHFEALSENKANWRVWLTDSGVGNIPSDAGMHYNNYQAVMNAAIDGQGIALGCNHLIDSYLLDDKLVRPFTQSVKTGNGFWVFTLDDIPLSKDAALFMSWLNQLGEKR